MPRLGRFTYYPGWRPGRGIYAFLRAGERRTRIHLSGGGKKCALDVSESAIINLFDRITDVLINPPWIYLIDIAFLFD